MFCFLPGEFDGEAVHAGVVIAFPAAAGVAGDVVAEDVIELAIGADERRGGGTIEAEDGAAEGGGDVQRAGIIADDEFGAGEEEDHFGEGGSAGEI